MWPSKSAEIALIDRADFEAMNPDSRWEYLRAVWDGHNTHPEDVPVAVLAWLNPDRDEMRGLWHVESAKRHAAVSERDEMRAALHAAVNGFDGWREQAYKALGWSTDKPAGGQ